MFEEFVDVRILDNFYQTSGFYPMPVVLVSTFAESGTINLGPYSLCFPHYITGTGEWAMMLICRDSSNTARNLVRTKVCSINFIPHKKKYLKNCVQLGYPGDKTEEKMKQSKFALLPSEPYQQVPGEPDNIVHPHVVKEAVQVFQCSWDDSYTLKHNEDLVECHFLLHLDRIIMKEKWQKCLYKGKGFPILPINFGFRDNMRFWFSRHTRPYHIPLPKGKGNSLQTIKYACGRYDPDIKWEDEACAKIMKVPQIFLKKVIEGTVKAAKEEGLTVITPEFMDKLRDKRSGDRKKP